MNRSCREDVCFQSVANSARDEVTAAEWIPVGVITVVYKMTIVQSRHIETRVSIRDKHSIAKFTWKINIVFQIRAKAEPKQGSVSGENNSGGHGKSLKALINRIREQIGGTGIELPVAAVGQIEIQQSLPTVAVGEFSFKGIQPGLSPIKIPSTAQHEEIASVVCGLRDLFRIGSAVSIVSEREKHLCQSILQQCHIGAGCILQTDVRLVFAACCSQFISKAAAETKCLCGGKRKDAGPVRIGGDTGIDAADVIMSKKLVQTIF